MSESVPEFSVDTTFESFANIKFPRWENLPDIELYMDQVIALMEKYLCKISVQRAPGADEDKIITSSMVNNYVKKGYMPAPIKKKYGKEHIAHLLIICIMKQSIPISVIDFFIKTLLEVMDMDTLLDLFIDSYEASFISNIEDMREIYDGVRDTLENDLTAKAVMSIRATAMANAGKLVGEMVNDSLANKW